jgi:hypothetical protein
VLLELFFPTDCSISQALEPFLSVSRLGISQIAKLLGCLVDCTGGFVEILSKQFGIGFLGAFHRSLDVYRGLVDVRIVLRDRKEKLRVLDNSWCRTSSC